MRVRNLSRRRSWTWPLASIAFAIVVVALSNPRDAFLTSADRDYVQRVVDGDTLLLATGERVRLIGVDTPSAEFDRPTRHSL